MGRARVPVRKYPSVGTSGIAEGGYSAMDTTGVDPDPGDRTKIFGKTRMRQPGDVAPKPSAGHSAWQSLLKLFGAK